MSGPCALAGGLGHTGQDGAEWGPVRVRGGANTPSAFAGPGGAGEGVLMSNECSGHAGAVSPRPKPEPAAAGRCRWKSVHPTTRDMGQVPGGGSDSTAPAVRGQLSHHRDTCDTTQLSPGRARQPPATPEASPAPRPIGHQQDVRRGLPRVTGRLPTPGPLRDTVPPADPIKAPPPGLGRLGRCFNAPSAGFA